MYRTHFGLGLDRDTTSSLANMRTPHSHQVHELFFLLSGQRRYFVEDTIFDVAPGDVVLVPRTLLHKTVSLGNKGFDRYLIEFTQAHSDAFASIAGRDVFSAYPKGECFQLPADKVLQIQRYFEEMEKSILNPGEWTQASCVTIFYNILLTCFSYGKPKSPFLEDNADKIQQAARYISMHYADLVTLDDVAEYVHMEKTYFSKRFKALTGFGFLDYLTQTRLRKAEELLSVTNLSIGDISDACGFSGASYFGTVFRRYHQISPTEYRLRSQKK